MSHHRSWREVREQLDRARIQRRHAELTETLRRVYPEKPALYVLLTLDSTTDLLALINALDADDPTTTGLELDGRWVPLRVACVTDTFSPSEEAT